MPVSFKYKDLRNQDCGIAIRKIKAVEGLAPKTAYQATKLLAWIGKEEKIAQELFQKVAHEFAEKHEDGSLKPAEGAEQGSWEIKEPNKSAFTKKVEEWAEVEVVNDKWEKLKATELSACKLSPGELLGVEWLVDLECLNEDVPAKP